MQQESIVARFTNVRVKSLSPFAHYAIGLRFTHESLRRNLRIIMRVAEADQDRSDAFLDFAALYVQSLTGHHQVEDTIIFPALARAGSDVVIFETFEGDHRSVHRLLEDLARGIASTRASTARSLQTLHRIASDF
jgi:hemerythrin-like domain-containing protein